MSKRKAFVKGQGRAEMIAGNLSEAERYVVVGRGRANDMANAGDREHFEGDLETVLAY